MYKPSDYRAVSLERVLGLAGVAKVDNQPWAQDFIRAVALSDDPALEESLCP